VGDGNEISVLVTSQGRLQISADLRSVVAALAPVCADKVRALPDAKIIALSKVEAWKRGEEFPKEIVTLPGEISPNYALVYACSTLLLAPKSAALQ
jgi:hypothetical protein